MNPDPHEEERPIAWLAILDRTPVFTSDDECAGIVSEVLGSEDEDIFHGLEVSEGASGHIVLVPAENVTAITNRKITVDLSAEEVRRLPPYRAEDSYRLGFIGFFRRRLGWVEEKRQGP